MTLYHLYRFYCGDDNTRTIGTRYLTALYVDALVRCGVKGYTMYSAIGSWEGVTEQTRVFEILSDVPIDWESVQTALKTAGNQESILVTHALVDAAF
jgi:PII-like signaling protein